MSTLASLVNEAFVSNLQGIWYFWRGLVNARIVDDDSISTRISRTVRDMVEIGCSMHLSINIVLS